MDQAPASVTTTASEIVRQAVRDARAVRSPVIGQEHVLMALGTAPDSLGAALMTAFSVTAPTMREHLVSFVRRGPEGVEPQPTPRLLKALAEAEAEAAEHQRATTSADLVLGILRTHHGVGFQLLTGEGVTLDRARAAHAALPAMHAELDATEPASLAAVLAGEAA